MEKKEKNKYKSNNDLVLISKRLNNRFKNIKKNKKKVISINSFAIKSRTIEKLNDDEEIEKFNNNNYEILNASVATKLNDTIKENILKMKNPKKKNQMTNIKIIKVLKEIKSLKTHKTPKKYNKKIRFKQKGDILSKGSKKQHTIIKNRNASVHLDTKYNTNNDIQKKNLHKSMKTNKDKRYIKIRNDESIEIKKSTKNSIKIDNNKKSMRIPKKKEIKEILTYNNNKTSKSLKINILSNNNKEQNRKNHKYLKTDVEINNKMNKNIRQKNRNSEIIKEFKTSSSKCMDYKNFKKRSENKDEKVYNSFIDKKKEKNNEQLRVIIEPYGYRKISKQNQNNQNKKNINNHTTFTYSHYTNGIYNKESNKNNNYNIRKNKIFLSHKNDDNNIINKSTEFRPKIRNTLYNNIKKLDDYKYKENENNKSIEKKIKKVIIKKDKNTIYKGPLDIKCLIISDSIECIHKKVVKSLHINQIKYWKLNPLKYSCYAKNMDKFYIEICLISELKEYKESIKKNKDIKKLDENNDINNVEMKYLYFIKLLLSKEINDIPKCRLLEKVINNIKSN